MRHPLRTVLLLLSLGAVPALAAPVAIVNVNVVTMQDDAVHAQQTVVTRDGRIEAIGHVDDLEIPLDALVVDGTNRYLLPGLAEMHAHVPPLGSDELERVLTLFVVNGVTSVRGMLGSPSHLQMRDDLENGDLFGPRLYTSGPSFNGNSVSSPRDAADRVGRQQLAGYDFLKVHPGLTRAEFMAMAEAANDAGIRFAGHVPADVELLPALAAGISTIDHLDGYFQALLPPNEDPSGGFGGFFGLQLAGWARTELIDEAVAATVAAGTWNAPTQTLFEHRVNAVPPAEIAAWPEMRYMPSATVREWTRNKQALLDDASFDAGVAARAIELRRRLVKALHDSGAPLLLGSDAPQVFNVPGFSAHRELELLVAAGLTPYEALRTGTVNAARWFGAGSSRGVVAEGRQADLVLLDDNPLEDIRNSRRVHGVMLRGAWLDRPQLDALLARFER